MTIADDKYTQEVLIMASAVPSQLFAPVVQGAMPIHSLIWFTDYCVEELRWKTLLLTIEGELLGRLPASSLVPSQVPVSSIPLLLA